MLTNRLSDFEYKEVCKVRQGEWCMTRMNDGVCDGDARGLEREGGEPLSLTRCIRRECLSKGEEKPQKSKWNENRKLCWKKWLR